MSNTTGIILENEEKVYMNLIFLTAKFNEPEKQ